MVCQASKGLGEPSISVNQSEGYPTQQGVSMVWFSFSFKYISEPHK